MLKDNRGTSRASHTVIKACGIGLALLVAGMLTCPNFANLGANALENSSAKAMSSVVLNATATVGVSLDSSIMINTFGSEYKDSFNVGIGTLKVSTNNREGYSVFLGTESETTSLLNANTEDPSSVPSISALPSNAKLTKDQFTNDTWGYSILNAGETVGDTTTYSGITTDLTNIKVTDAASDEDVYQLAFGTKISKSLPAGQYVNQIVVSVVANPTTITNLSELVYMQDMDSTICKNTADHVTKRLIDIRDGKSYWVAKLKDGNCWMTQNLDYDMVAGKVLTPSDTNISENYQIKRDTEKDVPTAIKLSENNGAYYTERSWDLGEYVLATPLKSVICVSPTAPSTESPDTDDYNSLRHGDTFDVCSDFQNVSGWLPTYQAQTGTWNGEAAGNGAGNTSAEGLVAADVNTRTYDAHYLIGNYYQYNAATLGGALDSVDTKTDINRSICPKGWKLPTSGNANTAENGSGTDFTTTAFVSKDDSFYNLLAEYGYANGDQNGNQIGYRWDNGNPKMGIKKGSSANNYSNNVAASPLYFMRAGSILQSAGSVRYAGFDGRYWSSTTYPDDNKSTYDFLFNGVNVFPADYYQNRGSGFTVRCIAE